jgi:hypothetical protein
MRRTLRFLPPLLLPLLFPPLFPLLLLVSAPGFAQQRPRLEPLPEPPPPPPGVSIDAPGDQPVRIDPGPNDRVEETVVEGKRTVKVTQPGGRVYYLQEAETGESPINDGLSPRVRGPRWVIKEF